MPARVPAHPRVAAVVDASVRGVLLAVALALAASTDVAVIDGASTSLALRTEVRDGVRAAGRRVLDDAEAAAAVRDAEALGVHCQIDDGKCWIKVGLSTEIGAFVLVERRGDLVELQAVDVERKQLAVRSFRPADGAARAQTEELVRAAFASTGPPAAVGSPPPPTPPPTRSPPPLEPSPPPEPPPPVVDDEPGFPLLAVTGGGLAGVGIVAAAAAGTGAVYLDVGLSADLADAAAGFPLPDDHYARRDQWAVLAVVAVAGAVAAVTGGVLLAVGLM